MNKRVPLVAFVGPHNSGKTRLVEELTRRAVRRGLKVGVIKRAARPLQFEPSGKDSARFARAGAARVVTQGPGMLCLLEPHPGSDAALLARRFGAGLDLWLVENYALEKIPWVAVARAGQTAPALDLRCIATVGRRRAGLPHFPFSAAGRLLDFICQRLAL